MFTQATKNPSVMHHNFSRAPQAEIPRSSFKRSFSHKTTLNSGYLIPVLYDEVLPGDTYKVNLSAVMRMNTPIAPLMDNLYVDYFFFAVPNRLLWSNWQKFMGEQANPGDSIDYLVPQVEAPESTGWAAQSIADYFGLPLGLPNLSVNALHFRAYNLIYNEWFRDQNLIDSVPVSLGDGPDDPADYVLLKRGKRHDYFTSCLPWPQKGPGVELPLGDTAPVKLLAAPASTNASLFKYALTNGPAGGITLNTNVNSQLYNSSNSQTLVFDPNGRLFADLANATAATINSLREAFQLQRLMERDARGGTRYTELIQSHFGVTSPDARMQRPEFLGGGTKAIVFDPIPSTAGAGIAQLGVLGAAAYSNHSGIGFSKSFTEHSVIIGLASIRADLTYQRGINRMWDRRTKYDYYWPALAHIGEQAVLNREIYFDGTSADNNVFGYQEAWAEYRYYPSLITGLMRSTHPQSLDIWHASQDFDTRPVLNADFISEAPPIDRLVYVPSQPHFTADLYFDMVCARPMPMYSVPGLIDHF